MSRRHEGKTRNGLKAPSHRRKARLLAMARRRQREARTDSRRAV